MTAAFGLAPEDLQTIVDEVWTSLLTAPPEEAVAWSTAEGDIVAAGVGISGCWSGSVVIETSEQGAVELAATLLSVRPDHVGPSDLTDAVGEMANIVGGSVKSCLDGVAQLSLPWVERVPGGAGPQASSALQVTATWRTHPLRVTVQPGTHPFREVRS